MFLDYNINSEISIKTFLEGKVADDSIDDFQLILTGTAYQMTILKDGYYFYVAEKDGEYYATEMQTDLTDVQAGFAVVTVDSFNASDGNMTLDPGDSGESTLIFYEEVSGDMNFEIKSGTVTIYITQDMTLTNENMSRSAIDISSGATLNLYFVDDAQIIVNSGYGTSAAGHTAGKGGYAGIHVPEGATLNLYGEGALTAIGGDAGDGGTLSSSGESRESGAGAGGAGGTCCAGAGGYTGGAGDGIDSSSENGLGGGGDSTDLSNGGGYFAGGYGKDLNGLDRATLVLGGLGNTGVWGGLTDLAGNGGTAGFGGNINVSETSLIYAFNGNLYTDGTDYENGLNQCPIYLQNGIIVAKYGYESYLDAGQYTYANFYLTLISNQSSVELSGYSNSYYDNLSEDELKKYKYITQNDVLTNVDMSTQGVGSGAGYIELSNGTYTIDSSMN